MRDADSLEYLASASFGEHREGSDIPQLLRIARIRGGTR